LPLAVHVVEQERRARRDFHLGVKAAALEFFGASIERIPERVGFIQSAPVHRRRNTVQAGVKRIDENDSPPREQARHQLAVG
jgi:hypothetical protein